MEAWDRKAGFWDTLMGDEGNLFQRTLVMPATGRLLALRPGERVLDLACGTGVTSRWLHRHGARVVAVDGSGAMLERARARGPADIDYREVDLTAPALLESLGTFDALVCTMAFMDIQDLDPLLQAVPRLLEPGGRMVAVQTHPCFNFHGSRLFLEQEDREGEIVLTRGVRVSGYLEPRSSTGAGAPGEPVPHRYHHRPLQDLLGRCFAAGLALDGLEEPAFAEPSDKPGLTWAHLTGIPPVLALRLRAQSKMW